MPDDVRTLDQLATRSRWVAWHAELRNDRPNRTPCDPAARRMAQANNPSMRGTRNAAEEAFRQLEPSPHGPGRIGIVLDGLDGGRILGGVDMDACRDPGTGAPEPWAIEAINAFDAYTEISPSRTGAKTLFTFDASILPALRRLMVSENGTVRKRPHSGLMTRSRLP